MKQPYIFQVTDLTKQYKKRTVVDSISFHGKQGEILGFLGPNGAGKTTTIRMMTGLAKKTKGSVLITGHNIDQDFEQAICEVGAIVETPVLFEKLTGKQNLAYFSTAKNCTNEQIEHTIEQIGLGDFLNEKVQNYSLGMKQRLAIGIALLTNPKLLILDEPTNGLDPIAIRNLRFFLKELAHKKQSCILISSHLLWEVEKLCDRVMILSEGKIIGEAVISDILESGYNLEDFYIEQFSKSDNNKEQSYKKEGAE